MSGLWHGPVPYRSSSMFKLSHFFTTATIGGPVAATRTSEAFHSQRHVLTRYHGDPWGSMGIHGDPWGSMGIHGDPWGSMGIHGDPWGSMGIHGDPWGSNDPGKTPGWRLGREPRWHWGDFYQWTNGGVSYIILLSNIPQTFKEGNVNLLMTKGTKAQKMGWKQQRNWVSGSLEMINAAVSIWVCLKSSGLSSLSLWKISFFGVSSQ